MFIADLPPYPVLEYQLMGGKDADSLSHCCTQYLEQRLA